MKLEQNAGTLSLATSRNWVLVFLGAALILLALVLATFSAKLLKLDFQRVTPEFGYLAVTEDRYWWEGKRISRITLRRIKGAVAVAVPINPTFQFYRLALTIDDGLGPFWITWFPSRAETMGRVEAINAFLADASAQRLVLEKDNRPFFYPLAAGLGLFGLTMVLWGMQRTRTLFDKEAGTMAVQRRGMFLRQGEAVALSDISHFDVAGILKDCQLYAVLFSGRRIRLSSSSDAEGVVGPHRVRAERLKTAKALREFLL